MAKNNVVKFRTRREVNIGLVIAFGILILMLIQLYRYFTTPHLSVYEVMEGKAESEFIATAMILRNETVYTTKNAGYLNFYYREGARVSKGAKVYSLNDSSNLRDLLSLDDANTVLTPADLTRLKSDIRDFCMNYSDVSFEDCYQMKENFLADYLRYRDISMLDAVNSQVAGNEKSFYTDYSSQSGMITYYSDRYDGYTIARMDGTEFSEENRSIPARNSVTGMAERDSFAYKLVDDLNWELVVELSKDNLATLIANGDTIRFSIDNEDTIYEKKYETVTIGTSVYLRIPMQRFVKDYLRYRFLEVTIYIDAATGLKIPKTALVEREIFQIPERFIVTGGGKEEDELGISLEYFDSDTGETAYEFYKIEPLFYENGYYYLTDADPLAQRYIAAPVTDGEPERAMLYTFLTKMEGVYNMNKGYAVFRRIVRITDIDGYILVKAGLAGGVSLYDHIVLDTAAVSKDVILVEGD